MEHVFPEGHARATHWDLMIEDGAALATWALERAPDEGRSVGAERLADHRRSYLDYEGPVSGDRGHVTRWDAGACTVHEREAGRWVVELVGEKLDGMMTIVGDDQNWIVTFERSARR